MEAVPRLSMICCDLKVSPQNTEFGPILKKYIRDHYNEDPESYSKEIKELETLRLAAIKAPVNFTGCCFLKRYYCQLQKLKSRFPMTDDGAACVPFMWTDIYSGLAYNITDIEYEEACILYNIGALHSKLGTLDLRINAEGIKIACTHFQCAAWAFQHLRDTYPQPKGSDMSHDLLTYFINIMLTQAQECILEKSMLDNRKSSITAKIAAQVVDYYKCALGIMTSGSSSDSGSVPDIVGSKVFKTWKKCIEFKMAYYMSISHLYMGNQAEENQKWGERVAWFQSAHEHLSEAFNIAKNLDRDDMNEALTFTNDVVGGKYSSSKKENDFVYHEKVPALSSLPELKGASLVKGIPFSPSDPEVSGPDIFGRLVPMEAHETSSLYSEEKAKILRTMMTKIDGKNEELMAFLSSMQLETAMSFDDEDKVPQELLEKCAAMSVRPTAISDLTNLMKELFEVSKDVESSLKTAILLLAQDEERELKHQGLFGKRGPSMIVVELMKECSKYEEAHRKASASNETLKAAVDVHINNLKKLALPLDEITESLPSASSIKTPDNVKNMDEFNHLVSKVDEMRKQRQYLESQLRDSLMNDDITKRLITFQKNDDLQQTFAEELKKHSETLQYLDQNLSAQDNILCALTEANARFADTRMALKEIRHKREEEVKALVESFEAYEDLIEKAKNGLEFYKKLQNSAQRVLARVKSVINVQDEERTQRAEAEMRKGTRLPGLPASQDQAPKLKDYLPYMNKRVPGISPVLASAVPRVPSAAIHGVHSSATPGVYSSAAPGAHNSAAPGVYSSAAPGVHSSASSDIHSVGTFGVLSGAGPSARIPPVANVGVSPVPSVGVPTVPDANTSTFPMYPIPASVPTSVPFMAESMRQVTLGGPFDFERKPKSLPDAVSSEHSSRIVNSVQQPPFVSEQTSIPAPCTPASNIATVNANQCIPQQPVQPANLSMNLYNTSQHSQTVQMPANSIVQPQSPGILPNSGLFQHQRIPPVENLSNNIPSNETPYSSMTSYTLQKVSNASVPHGYQSLPNSFLPSSSHMQPVPNASPATFQENSSYGVPPNFGTQSISNTSGISPGSHMNIAVTSSAFPSTPQYASYNQPVNSALVGPSVSVSSSASTLPHFIAPATVPLPSGFVPQTYNPSGSNSTPYYPPATVNSVYNGPGVIANAPYNSSTLPTSNVSTTALNQGAPSAYSQFDQAWQSQMYATSAYAVSPGAVPNSSVDVRQYYQTTGPSMQAKQASVTASMDTNTNTLNSLNPYAVSNVNIPNSQGQYAYGTNISISAVPSQPNCPVAPSGNISVPSVSEYGNISTPGNYNSYPAPGNQMQPNSGYVRNLPSSSPNIQNAGTNGSYYSPGTLPQATVPAGSRVDGIGENFNILNMQLQAPIEPKTNVSNLSPNTNTAQNGVHATANQDQQVVQKSEVAKTVQDFITPLPNGASINGGQENPESQVLQPKIVDLKTLMEKKEKEIVNSVKDPLDDSCVRSKFISEVEKYEKVVDGLVRKSLNGTTPLDQKWKEFLDMQDKESRKLSISVARCYPLKNRFPDVMPYDTNRVQLASAKDDYINASYLKDICPKCPVFVITQSPLPATFSDFWLMVWEQQVETLICLLSDAELKNHIYYPKERGQVLTYGAYEISLHSCKEKNSFIERMINITHVKNRTSRVVVHLQFTQWPVSGVPSPANFLQFVNDSLSYYMQQRNLMRPIVVHCSGGIGRSGCFCLIAALVSEMNNGHGPRDISQVAAFVCNQRKFLVQDKDQLKFCYDTVLYYAQDILMRRGILTTRASFDDKLPTSGSTSSHVRHPSEDFILGGGLAKLQSGITKLGLSGDEATPLSKPPDVSPKKEPASENGIAKEASTPEPSAKAEVILSKETSADVLEHSDLKEKSDTCSKVADENVDDTSDKKEVVEKTPPSITNLLDPLNFTLDAANSPAKRRITKENFGTSKGSLSTSSSDSADPLSQLDPLWSLKK